MSHCPEVVTGALSVQSVLKVVKDAPKEMIEFLSELWLQDEGQDVAEYAVMLAVVLVITIGTVQLIGSHANAVFSSIASSIQ
jgi:Flp pilus assembly pilin Flp